MQWLGVGVEVIVMFRRWGGRMGGGGGVGVEELLAGVGRRAPSHLKACVAPLGRGRGCRLGRAAKLGAAAVDVYVCVLCMCMCM